MWLFDSYTSYSLTLQPLTLQLLCVLRVNLSFLCGKKSFIFRFSAFRKVIREIRGKITPSFFHFRSVNIFAICGIKAVSFQISALRKIIGEIRGIRGKKKYFYFHLRFQFGFVQSPDENLRVFCEIFEPLR